MLDAVLVSFDTSQACMNAVQVP